MPSDDPAAPPLPEMWQATLDAQGLAELFEDYERATPVHIVVRERAHQMVANERAAAGLDDALALLSEGLAVQVRYRWEGAEWWDTLRPTAGGARLIRVRHDFDPPVGG